MLTPVPPPKTPPYKHTPLFPLGKDQTPFRKIGTKGVRVETALGREMLDTVKGRPTGKPVRLDVGIADVVPKLIVKRLLEPAFELARNARARRVEERRRAPRRVHELERTLGNRWLRERMARGERERERERSCAHARLTSPWRWRAAGAARSPGPRGSGG